MRVSGHFLLKSGTNFQGDALTPSGPLRSDRPSGVAPLMSFEHCLVEACLVEAAYRRLR